MYSLRIERVFSVTYVLLHVDANNTAHGAVDSLRQTFVATLQFMLSMTFAVTSAMACTTCMKMFMHSGGCYGKRPR